MTNTEYLPKSAVSTNKRRITRTETEAGKGKPKGTERPDPMALLSPASRRQSDYSDAADDASLPVLKIVLIGPSGAGKSACELIFVCLFLCLWLPIWRFAFFICFGYCIMLEFLNVTFICHCRCLVYYLVGLLHRSLPPTHPHHLSFCSFIFSAGCVWTSCSVFPLQPTF